MIYPFVAAAAGSAFSVTLIMLVAGWGLGDGALMGWGGAGALACLGALWWLDRRGG